jgi:SAM-dependent methyltransferase
LTANIYIRYQYPKVCIQEIIYIESLKMKEFWDQRYSAKEYIYGQEPNNFVKAQLQLLEPGKLLLPCEGEGRNAVFAARNNWDVLAIDQSIEGQKKAFALAKTYHVSFRYDIGDMLKYEFTNEDKFDVIALVFAHFPPEIRSTIHSRLINQLKHGGKLMLEAFSTSQLGKPSGGPPALEMLYDKNTLFEDFKKLNTVHLSELNTELQEGSLHRGEASLIRYVGEKSNLN